MFLTRRRRSIAGMSRRQHGFQHEPDLGSTLENIDHVAVLKINTSQIRKIRIVPYQRLTYP